jgi:outer membrane protein OmpA-like peptidoglycan-associated protein
MDASVALDVRGSRFLPAPAVGRSEPAETSFGDVGDTEIGLRVGLPAASKRLSASLEAFAVLPTGNADKGLSADAADGGLLLGATAQGGGAKIYLQAGYRVNRNEGEGVLLYPIFYPKLAPGEDDTDNDALMIRGALEVHSERVDLFVELLADRLMGSEAVRGRENFLEAAPGFRVRLRRGLYVSASAGFNLSEDDPATQSLASPEVLFPDWRLSVGVQWIGLIGGTDRDDDGIADGFDRCPDSREDYDGCRDEDGCPDADNDKDAFCDPWVPEKGLQATWEKICKGKDGCPDEPETVNTYQDDDGCPDKAVVVEKKKIVILQTVLFYFNETRIKEESFPLLDEVVTVLKDNPQLLKIRIEGHTDERGDAGYNKKLSAGRVKTVLDYLVEKGIDQARLTSQGLGESKPLVKNAQTEEDHQKNRRVEFIIVEESK